MKEMLSSFFKQGCLFISAVQQKLKTKSKKETRRQPAQLGLSVHLRMLGKTVEEGVRLDGCLSLAAGDGDWGGVALVGTHWEED